MKVTKKLEQYSANLMKSEGKKADLKSNSWFAGNSIKYNNISCENLIIKLKELSSTRAGANIESDLLQMLQMPTKYKFNLGNVDHVEIKFIESDSEGDNNIIADSASMAHIANKMAEHGCDRFSENDTKLLLKHATDPKLLNDLKSHLQQLLNDASGQTVDHNSDNNKSSVNLVPDVGKSSTEERANHFAEELDKYGSNRDERKRQLKSLVK